MSGLGDMDSADCTAAVSMSSFPARSAAPAAIGVVREPTATRLRVSPKPRSIWKRVRQAA